MADQIAPQQPKNAAHRSPNYPAFSLGDALEKVRIVYDKDKKTATTPSVIAGHLGYKHTNGPGGRALSCLRQYGLLEDAGGLLKVSDAAFNLLHLPVEDADRATLLKQAALKPNLYRQLKDEYPDGIPSDATLKSNLLKKGFNPDSVDTAIEAFRATMQVAKVYDVSDNATEEESKVEVQTTITPIVAPSTPIIPQVDPATGKSYALDFEGNGRAVLTLTGEYTNADLDDLESYIETSLKILRRSLAKKEQVQ